MKPHLEVWVLLIENNRATIKSKKLYKGNLPPTLDRMLKRECDSIETNMFLEQLKRAQAKAYDGPLFLDRT